MSNIKLKMLAQTCVSKQAENLAETERQAQRTIEDRSGGSAPQLE